jgi:pyruvate-ferredoxin/flavodoxin oxidoreductase
MLLRDLTGTLGDTLVGELLDARQDDEAGIAAQRGRVATLRTHLADLDRPAARDLGRLADYLVRKSVWIVGGDGWAYDIGYGGLDHVLALGRDVNILVLDTEVYSNTGGQQSKATPLGAAAKFAAAGKRTPKKDLGLMAMSAGHAYVAQVALGARDAQALRALQEAESYPGPSLIIAFSPCIAHGYDLRFGAEQQKRAVESGYWPVYRYDPRRLDRAETPLVLDTTGPPKLGLADYVSQEARFRMVEQQDPPAFRELMASAERELRNRIALYETLAHLAIPKPTT